MRNNRETIPTDVPNLPPEWRWRSLLSLVQEDRGISYGVVQPGDGDVLGIPIVRADNVRDGHINVDSVLRISRGIESKYARTRLRGGEVLLTLVGAYFGKATVAPPELTGWNVARAVAVIPVIGSIEPEWVTYCLRSPMIQKYIQNWATTTAQPTLNLRDVAQLPIPLPPPRERRLVVEFLDALERKLALNSATNATIEKIAGTVFQSWFVDSNRSQASMPAAFDSIATISREAVNPAEYPTESFDHYSIPAFDQGCLPIVEIGEHIKSNKFVVQEDSVLLSKLNPRIPRIWMPLLSGTRRAICSTEFLVIEPRGISSREYLYGLCSSQSFLDTFAMMVTGTSGSHQRVKPEYLQQMPVVVPTEFGLRRYTELVRPLHAKVAQKLRERSILSALRDAILPKLVSGTIRFKELETVVEANA